MLVDLARNDLGRVCLPGSVEVVEFMTVERYSHVMHLVSVVEGDLAPAAAPTTCWPRRFRPARCRVRPKPRAMELIEELEPVRRGLYGGVVGYLDVAGDMDLAIAIRTALIREGVAHVQAGAGIVARLGARARGRGVSPQGGCRASGRRCGLEPAVPVSRGRTVALVLLGCALMLASTTQDWARGTVDGAGAVAVSGSAAAGVVGALAWAAAAGAGALSLAQGGARRPLAVVILLAAVGGAWATVVVLTDPAAALRPAVTAATGTTAAALTGVGTTGWPWPALLGAALVATAGAGATARADRWPVAAARFEPVAGTAADPRDTWQALDRGEDPT